MTDQEYREFLAFVFERYVRPRLSHVRRRFHHHMMEEWDYQMDKAARAAHVLRFIESYCENDDDVYQTFTAERLARAVSDTRFSFEFSNRTVEEAGFLDALEDHGREILAGLEVKHLPDVDKEVLKDSGSVNPEVELRVLVSAAKSMCERFNRSRQEVPIRQELRAMEERLERSEKLFGEDKEKKIGPGEKPKKSRRWFKGLGQIAQGASLSIANVALAVGVLRFPVSPETQTWGAVASVATGVSTVLNGIGDLRGE
ncbi:MAG TPA: hypothetical protein VI685_24640 [Candidatus Angelobacter sp.]